MNQFIRPVQITPEAHLIQSFWKAPGAPVGVHINSMVLAGRQPVVFDTGVTADRDGWLAAVTAVVDPEDVRWIVLSHDDPDHTGNLAAAVEQFPNAMVVASWWMTERLVGSLDADDLCLCLISGGGSALLPAPVDGVTLEDKQAVTRHLSAAGANITRGPVKAVYVVLTNAGMGDDRESVVAGKAIDLSQ